MSVRRGVGVGIIASLLVAGLTVLLAYKTAGLLAEAVEGR